MLRNLKKASTTNSKKVFDTTLEQVDISSDWKKLLHDRIVEDTLEAGNFHRLRAVHKNWNWITSKSDIYWIVIDTLDYLGAASVSMIRDAIIDDHELEVTEQKQEWSIEKAIRRALKRIHTVDVLDTICLEEDVLGHERYKVTLWLSPFVTPKQIARTKKLYANTGGFNMKKKKKPLEEREEEWAKAMAKRSERVKRHKDQYSVKELQEQGYIVHVCECNKIYKMFPDNLRHYKVKFNVIFDHGCPCGGKSKIIKRNLREVTFPHTEWMKKVDTKTSLE